MPAFYFFLHLFIQQFIQQIFIECLRSASLCDHVKLMFNKSLLNAVLASSSRKAGQGAGGTREHVGGKWPPQGEASAAPVPLHQTAGRSQALSLSPGTPLMLHLRLSRTSAWGRVFIDLRADCRVSLLMGDLGPQL